MLGLSDFGVLSSDVVGFCKLFKLMLSKILNQGSFFNGI